MATSAQFSYYGKPVLNIRGSVQLIFSGLFGCSSSAAAHTYLSGVAGVIVDVASRRLLPFSFCRGTDEGI